MPEASVYENDGEVPRQDDVRFTRIASVTDAEAEPGAVKGRADGLLGRGIAAADVRHVGMTLGLGEDVHRESIAWLRKNYLWEEKMSRYFRI